MKKRLIIFCDGTWNSPDQIDEKTKRICTTNVVKLMRAVQPIAYSGPDFCIQTPQISYYDPGIGTEGIVEKYVGGATGYGISANILQAYRFLANNYQSGDEIFCFGFSRGAYTVRALCGFMGLMGLISPKDLDLLPRAYRYYRMSPEQRYLSPEHEFYLSLKESSIENFCIRFLGVWDSVGAMGVPTPMLQKLSQRWVGFFDVKLGHYIQTARQALAIDERRGAFAPDLWVNTSAELAQYQDIQQVWFSGVHSNIGGGYEKNYLSDQTLLWMMGEAGDCGLQFNAEYVAQILAYTQQIELQSESEQIIIPNNYSLPYKMIDALSHRRGERAIGERQRVANDLLPAVNESVHPSVAEVMRINESYRPENLLKALDVGDLEYLSHERRHSPRIACYEPAELDVGQEKTQCLIVNQSTGGAGVSCKQPLRMGQLIHLSQKWKTITGQVVWAKDDYIGIKYAA